VQLIWEGGERFAFGEKRMKVGGKLGDSFLGKDLKRKVRFRRRRKKR